MSATSEKEAMDVQKLGAEAKDLQKKLEDAKREKGEARARRTEVVDRLVRFTEMLETEKHRREVMEKLVKIRCQKCEQVYGSREGMIPKFLSCGHTVCDSCVELLIEQKCPFDGQTVRPPYIVNQTILQHNADIVVNVD